MNVFTQIVKTELLMKDLDLGNPNNPLNALYFGIGLGTEKGLSYQLPFDVMLTILSGERIKRDLGLRSVNVLIADEHTKRADRHDPRIVDRLAEMRRNQIEGICEKLGLKSWEVDIASEITRTKEYQQILSELERKLPFGTSPYILMELADMEWFRRTQGTDIKLGWTSSATPHDEKWFDNYYRRHLGDKMTFPYTKAGRTVRGNAVPPYSHVGDSNDRLLLTQNETIEQKLMRMPPKVQKYYGHLTNMFAGLGYLLLGTQISERVREIYEAII